MRKPRGTDAETTVTVLAHELSEALEQQTATSEVLKVVSQSGAELAPVLDKLVATAARICLADSGFIFRLQDGLCRMVASFGVPQEYKDFQVRNPIVPDRGTLAGRTVLTRNTVHIEDASADSEYTRIEAIRLGHQRTMLGVPLVGESALIGVLTLARSWVEPFTDKQIALVQNFASQAVIAIENARLLRELRERTTELTESLEQQTATSEVLQVISSSPGELEPVFQAMLANATRLCDASYGAMWLSEGDLFRNAAFYGPLPAAYMEQWQSATVSVTAPLGRVAQSRKPLQIADLRQDQTYHDGHPLTLTAVHIANIHTMAIVPMLKGDEFVGVIAIYRKEVRPFTDKQIELVQNFANQSVIAIEKARLLEELRQSLQQQTATSEVLRVISSSPGELEPVFEIMLQKAVRLCDAKFGILYLSEGNGFRTVAMHNVPPSLVQLRQNKLIHFPVDASVTRAAVTKQPCHQIDARTERSYIEGSDSQFVAAVNLGGMRTVVSVPMLKDDKIIGVITIYRQEVRPFTDRQIELVTTFADQVAIALENARLLSELRQRTTDLSKALDQQTATSEVLQSISSSPGELEPVFQAILAHATRLCEAKFGSLYLRKEDAFRAVAMHGPSPIVEWLQREPVVELRDHPHVPLARVAQSKEVLHIRDLAADQAYIERDPRIVAVVELGGYRTVLSVPMLKEGELIGAIVIYRQEPRPFSDRQIELVSNFANQAVIAIENTRLLNELRKSLSSADLRADMVSRALDCLTHGVVLVDRSGLPLWLNRRAQEIVNGSNGLRLSSDGLAGHRPSDTRSLRDLIKGAASAGTEGLLAINRGDDLRPLLLIALPLRPIGNLDDSGQFAWGVVFISDPDRTDNPTVESLRRAFDLTYREAQTAIAIADGHGLQAAADTMGVALTTARSQLQQAFAKTGTRHQAELAALVHRTLTHLRHD